MQKITTFLTFDTQAEEAAQLYVSTFKNSRIKSVTRYPEGGPRPAGMAMTVAFELEGQSFMALNGGSHFKFTDAISLSVDCHTQAEIDELWDKLLAGGGAPVQCGWLRDRFGLSWQIVPAMMGELLGGPDGARSGRVMQAMLKMVKLDLAELKRAAE